MNKGFGEVSVPNIQSVPVPKRVRFGKVLVPAVYINNIDLRRNHNNFIHRERTFFLLISK